MIYWRMNATQEGANLHTGVNLLPGANYAHEHEDSCIPLLKRITNSIMEILRNIGSPYYSWNANRLRYTICTALDLKIACSQKYFEWNCTS